MENNETNISNKKYMNVFTGATLASPLNDKMANAMTNMTRQCDANHFGIFTGIHSIFSKGDYRSIEGNLIYKLMV